ncbi:pyridoxal-phosphate-dependent aminotransferase family protein [Candidatus Omnitrophota bacterium]
MERYSGRFVYVVHHETTTGLLNPLKGIASLCKKRGKILLVDGVSSIGGEKLKLKKWGIGLIIGSANKCIRGIPGLSFVIVSKSLIEEFSKGERRGYYLDLVKHCEVEEEGQTPFTPAVQAFYGFREALRELLEEGLDNRIEKYRETTGYLRGGLKKEGFRLLLPEKISSNTMTSVLLPNNLDYPALYKTCKDKGFIIYNAIGELEGKIFRLGTVGIVKKGDIQRFLRVLKDAKGAIS